MPCARRLTPTLNRPKGWPDCRSTAYAQSHDHAEDQRGPLNRHAITYNCDRFPALLPALECAQGHP